MRFNIFFALAIISILNLTISANALPWDNAPLACLPDRAERWETINQMEPCHCPPQELCPPALDLKPKDVTFYLSIRSHGAWSTAKIRGDEIAGFDPLLHLGTANHGTVWAAAKKKIPGPMSNVQAIAMSTSITNKRVIDQVRRSLDKYMPMSLRSTCCDSICPKGTNTQYLSENIDYYDAEPNPDYDADAAEEARVEKEDWVKSSSDGDDLPEPDDYEVPETISVKKTKLVETLTCKKASQYVYLREGCLIEGTPITLADGSAVKIEGLNVGDKLKGTKGAVAITAINKFTQGEDTIYGINGNDAFISEEHPLLTADGWKSVNPEVTSVKSNMGTVAKLAVGDKIITVDGEILVKSIDPSLLSDGVTVYNISVEGGEGFFANGMMVKDFNQVQIHY